MAEHFSRLLTDEEMPDPARAELVAQLRGCRRTVDYAVRALSNLPDDPTERDKKLNEVRDV